MKKKRMLGILTICVVCLFTLLKPLEVQAEEFAVYTYGYTGSEQIFQAPYTGMYQVELYGAQGGSVEENAGGRGGKVTATVMLNEGDVITVNVGGQNGFNGGGSGSVSNGGGATDIRRNGKNPADRIMVAGGGGGANAGYAGGDGGGQAAGAEENAEGASTSEGAGGGGGYLGGTAGIEHIVTHTHIGDKQSGGSCYKAVKHKHSGNSTSGGGCYTKANKHEHTDDCYNHNPIKEGLWIYSGVQAGSTVEGALPAYIYICNLCGDRMTTSSSTDGGGKHCQQGGEKTDLKCGYSTDSIISYSLGCGKTTNTVTGYELNCSVEYDAYDITQALGGSNWCGNLCSNSVSEAGVQSGDGICYIRAMSLYKLYFSNAKCLQVFYNGTKVKKVYYNGNLIYFG